MTKKLVLKSWERASDLLKANNTYKESFSSDVRMGEKLRECSSYLEFYKDETKHIFARNQALQLCENALNSVMNKQNKVKQAGYNASLERAKIIASVNPAKVARMIASRNASAMIYTQALQNANAAPEQAEQA